MTLTSQYIKFITDTQRRLEDEEVRNSPPVEWNRNHAFVQTKHTNIIQLI